MNDVNQRKLTKQELIDHIKKLISSDNSIIDINQKYIEYFEYDELLSIKNELEYKKQTQSDQMKGYLDDIYESCKG
ncbi:MAG: hypothetical protein IE909_03875 [Campylobacterales bacterium]|nr:hypothetical protein [Campylobacterales bacterium]